MNRPTRQVIRHYYRSVYVVNKGKTSVTLVWFCEPCIADIYIYVSPTKILEQCIGLFELVKHLRDKKYFSREYLFHFSFWELENEFSHGCASWQDGKTDRWSFLLFFFREFGRVKVDEKFRKKRKMYLKKQTKKVSGQFFILSWRTTMLSFVF